MAANESTKSEHVDRYLANADTFPHKPEGESVLLDQVPREARRILDLGTGDGRLLALLRVDRPGSVGVAVDVSEPMLERARQRFAGLPVELLGHDLAKPLPDLGRFDAVVSSFAIHHLEDERKRSLYAEVFARLEPGGVFANLIWTTPSPQNPITAGQIGHSWVTVPPASSSMPILRRALRGFGRSFLDQTVRGCPRRLRCRQLTRAFGHTV